MTDHDASARLAYLAESVDLLWPGTDRGLVVLPSRRAPRVLVPARPGRAGAAALVRYTAQQPVLDRLAALGIAGAALCGLTRFAIPVQARAQAAAGETVDELLARVLGEPVTSSLALTHPRPNRKPVLQVFDRRGRTVAFAKIGVTELARELIAREAAALTALTAAGPEHLDTPGVLFQGRWRDTFVLVTTALPMGRAVPTDDARLIDAMLEVSRIGGAGDDYPATLRAQAMRVEPNGVDWPALVDLAISAAGDLEFGSWHGDWTSWNCARRGGRLFAWDWERFTHPVPLGMDRLHYVLNEAVGPGRTDFPSAIRSLVDDAARLLSPWKIAATQSRAVAAIYCLDLALRYLADNPADADRIIRWSVPTVHDVVGAHD